MSDLNRLEQQMIALTAKVGEMSDAVKQVIKLEEKSRNMENQFNGLGKRVSDIEHHQTEITAKIAEMHTQIVVNNLKSSTLVKWGERILWFIVAAGLAGLNLFKGGGGS